MSQETTENDGADRTEIVGKVVKQYPEITEVEEDFVRIRDPRLKMLPDGHVLFQEINAYAGDQGPGWITVNSDELTDALATLYRHMPINLGETSQPE